MAGGSLVRPASSRGRACLHCDLPPIPYVEDTAITFETEVPDKHEMAARIAAARETHEWLILEQDDELIGYAYAHAFNSRAAYQWSAETSIYIAYARHGAGNGRRLYGQLLHRLSERGYRRAFEQLSIPVDQDLLCGLLGSGGVVGAFDEFAVLELRAGADERHEMGRVDRPPA